MANDNDRQPTAAKMVFRFRIVHLLYATALICSGLATFGTGGIVPAVILCAAWGWVFASESRPRGLSIALLFLLLSGCLCGLILPATQAVSEAARRMQCANNLKQIAIALHNYHDVYKSFPPAYIVDENGRPMHSWRVLILPFLEQQSLYDAYRFDEPWDGPNNRKLLNPMPAVYSCPSQQPRNSKPQSHTNYVAVVGENTAWPRERATANGDILDGISNTLLVCEVADPQISWMEPTDIDYADAMGLLTSRGPNWRSGHNFQSFFYERSDAGRNVALADAYITFIPQGIEADIAERLLTVNDGEAFDIGEIRGSVTSTRRLRIDNCIRLGVFVLIALWPLPWVWINPHGTRHGIRTG